MQLCCKKFRYKINPLVAVRVAVTLFDFEIFDLLILGF